MAEALRTVAARWQAQVAAFLPTPLQRAVLAVPGPLASRAMELRVRVGRPLLLVIPGADVGLAEAGPVEELQDALHPDRNLVQAAVQRLTGGSLYAVEEQLRRGYMTLPGGHRVGLSGRVALGPGGGVSALADVFGLSIRLSRPVRDIARPLLPSLLTGPAHRRRWCSVLVLAPPGAGKTTLLRELARLASEGVPELSLPGSQVVVVDERSEIAGCHDGVPQHDLGPRTDILDGCPKVEGILWALRALAPQVLVTDEIGGPGDVDALLRAAHSGASLLASAHADDLEGARRRRGLGELVELGVFQRAVVLSLRRGPGTVEDVAELAAG